MPRPRNRELTHCHHRPSGRGYVRLGEKIVYTGPWGSREANERFKVLNGEFLARGGVPESTPSTAAGPGLTVGDLADLYVVRHVLTYYRGPDGRETGEVRNIAGAMRMLKAVWGSTPAAEFSPLRLERLREALAQGRHRRPGERGSGGLARTRINREAQRVKQLFAWAVKSELVRPEVYYALLSVKALKRFRGGARETEPVRPVEDELIIRTLPLLTPTVRDMVLLQRLTGMRPGELVAMMAADLDRSSPVWLYAPGRHKTAHHGHARAIPLVAEAQRVLAPYLCDGDPGMPLFRPAESKSQGRSRRRATGKFTRRIKDDAGVAQEAGRSTARRAEVPEVAVGFTTARYRRAVARASLLAQLPPGLSVAGRQGLTQDERAELRERRRAWLKENAALAWHPHQIRHTVARGGKRVAATGES